MSLRTNILNSLPDKITDPTLVHNLRDITNTYANDIRNLTNNSLFTENEVVNENTDWDNLDLDSYGLVTSWQGQNAPNLSGAGIVFVIGSGNGNEVQVAISQTGIGIRIADGDWSLITNHAHIDDTRLYNNVVQALKEYGLPDIVGSINSLVDSTPRYETSMNSLISTVSSNSSTLGSLSPTVNSNSTSLNSMNTVVNSNSNSLNSMSTTVASNNQAIYGSDGIDSIASMNTIVNSNSNSLNSMSTVVSSNNQAIYGSDNINSIASMNTVVNSNSTSLNSMNPIVNSNNTSLSSMSTDVSNNTKAIYGSNGIDSIASNTTDINYLNGSLSEYTSLGSDSDIASSNISYSLTHVGELNNYTKYLPSSKFTYYGLLSNYLFLKQKFQANQPTIFISQLPYGMNTLLGVNSNGNVIIRNTFGGSDVLCNSSIDNGYYIYMLQGSHLNKNNYQDGSDEAFIYYNQDNAIQSHTIMPKNNTIIYVTVKITHCSIGLKSLSMNQSPSVDSDTKGVDICKITRSDTSNTDYFVDTGSSLMQLDYWVDHSNYTFNA